MSPNAAFTRDHEALLLGLARVVRAHLNGLDSDTADDLFALNTVLAPFQGTGEPARNGNPLDPAPLVLAERDRLLSAVYWALGEDGDFERPVGEHQRPYWWRDELRRRAFGDMPATVSVQVDLPPSVFDAVFEVIAPHVPPANTNAMRKARRITLRVPT